jgi:hypothetical protein
MLNDYAPVIAPVIAIINSVIAGQFLILNQRDKGLKLRFKASDTLAARLRSRGEVRDCPL